MLIEVGGGMVAREPAPKASNRSHVHNVPPSDPNHKLAGDIGQWYSGFAAFGIDPKNAGADAKQDSNEISGAADRPAGQLESTDSTHEKEKLADVVGIRVGGSREVEVNEKKDRMNDTLNATKVSVSRDAVAGDGVAVSYPTKVLDELESDTNGRCDNLFAFSVKVVGTALQDSWNATGLVETTEAFAIDLPRPADRCVLKKKYKLNSRKFKKIQIILVSFYFEHLLLFIWLGYLQPCFPFCWRWISYYGCFWLVL